MLRSEFAALAAAAALGMLAVVAPVRGDDLGDKLAPVGEAIKKGAEDTGTAIKSSAQSIGASIQQHSAPVVAAVKTGAQNAGTEIKQGAAETGNFVDRSTQGAREDAGSFFKKIGDFFSGK